MRRIHIDLDNSEHIEISALRPIEEQLKPEIEQQKAVFYMQHPLQIEEDGENNE